MTLVATGALWLATGCDDGHEATEPPTETAGGGDADSPTSSPEVELMPMPELHENILPKEVGELSGTVNPDTEEQTSFFILTEIRLGYRCDTESILRPLNGHFVGLHFDVSVLPAWAVENHGPFQIRAEDVIATTSEGLAVADPLGHADSCLSPENRLADPLEAGSKTSGWVLLDIPQDTTSIILHPESVDGGWEWALEW